MRITENIYMIGSGNFGISHVTDCNVYLIGSEHAFALIDAGSGIQSERILENIKAEKINKRDIRYLILTHSHWDHAGGSQELARALNCKICAHKLATEILGKGTWLGTPIENSRYQRGVKVDVELDEESNIDLESHKIRIVHTPGHSDDSVSLVVEFNFGIAVFCGDTILAGGKIGLVTNDTNLKHYANSIKRLSDIKPHAIFPGHGIFSMSNAFVHLSLSWERAKSSWYEVFPGPRPFNPSWWWKLSKEQKFVIS